MDLTGISFCSVYQQHQDEGATGRGMRALHGGAYGVLVAVVDAERTIVALSYVPG